MEARDNQADTALEALVADANAHLAGKTAVEVVAWACETFGDSIVLSSSFGVQSALMLHLVTSVKPAVPVVWIDTGYLFPETYAFAHELTDRLRLNLQVFQSKLSPARMEALHGRLWEVETIEAHRQYGYLRKVEPMERALRELNASALLVGLRAQQTAHRQSLDVVHLHNGRVKICPILHWTDADVNEYMVANNLPYHPLKAVGYETIGDTHSSRPVSKHDAVRDTRFRGIAQECGLHVNWSTPTDETRPAEPLDTSTVVVYSRPGCRYCHEAKAVLTAAKMSFKELVVDQDISYAHLCDQIGKAVQTVPQIFVRGKYVGGCAELKVFLNV
ncbi:phosphoadenosine phosphosulfate reductase [Achlya hypogyna]|uniref:Phosphoadenosine phosphosulfate reductase n=1 Tax=Achlya hypogyna TaxID=1202772 RepID=A0A1V9ZJW6_ACHHY|nr:phosphoadenosine phosphosulfate reductase [Achlya hypogyna]